MDASHYAVDAVLRDGLPVHLRAIRPDDKRALHDEFQRLSDESVFFRFLGPKADLNERDLRYLTEVDFRTHVALVAAVEGEAGEERLVGVGRYVVTTTDPAPRAELAFAVEEDYQGVGVGTLLMRHLARIAKAQGVAAFEALVHPSNAGMRSVFAQSGFPLREHAEGGLIAVTLNLGPSGKPETRRA